MVWEQLSDLFIKVQALLVKEFQKHMLKTKAKKSYKKWEP